MRILLITACIHTFLSTYSQLDYSFTAWQQVVPSENIPDDLEVKRGNNNLDLIQFNGKTFLAFRTAPSHFASPKTYLHILSSDDQEYWTWEHSIFLETDMREPRFTAMGDTLLFTFFEAGSKTLEFEPKKVWASLYTDEAWSPLIDLNLDGYVPWRIRERNDTLYMSAYYGVDIYNAGHQSDLRLFLSVDGISWVPISENPQLTLPYASECEFIFDSEGNFWAVIRQEGFGGFMAYADKNSLEQWNVKEVPDKYDSALFFEHEDEIFLISRRNLDGYIDKAPSFLSENSQRLYNLMRYSLTSKVYGFVLFRSGPMDDQLVRRPPQHR